MVKANLKNRTATKVPAQLPKFSTAIKISELTTEGLRFEAAAYNIEARRAVQEMKRAGYALLPIYGDSGIARFASKPTRFPRVYVDAGFGVPFLSSSDIISVRPHIENHLSRKLTAHLDDLLIREWDVLISRSGTVGNVGLASERLAGCALSEHAIRLRAERPEDCGFIAAFLRSRYGRIQLTQASYGSVVQHIEPEHLVNVLAPDVPQSTRHSVGSQMMKACIARNDANRLLDDADTCLHTVLKLKPLPDECTQKKGPVIVKRQASKLSFRFDASFHNPIAEVAQKLLLKTPWEIATMGDRRVTSEIRAITKFRKRVYVPTGGIPMLSSKQLLQIDPVDVKRLAKGAHTKDLPEIALKHDIVTVSCSGTIGRIQIIPGYMEGWTANQHATRLTCGGETSPGYLYAWLSSDYGQRLIRRFSYGSVIPEIDREMIGAVPIPLPPRSIRDEIAAPVHKANELRNQAWRLERQAIEHLEGFIESGDSKSAVPKPAPVSVKRPHKQHSC